MYVLCDFRDRPSVNTLLKKPLLQAKIRKFLSDLVPAFIWYQVWYELRKCDFHK